MTSHVQFIQSILDRETCLVSVFVSEYNILNTKHTVFKSECVVNLYVANAQGRKDILFSKRLKEMNSEAKLTWDC